LGFSHWAEEDKKIMRNFNNIKMIHPKDSDDMNRDFKYIIDKKTPVYMNLKR
jgi:transketolase C-terminal domain/subunit